MSIYTPVYMFILIPDRLMTYYVRSSTAEQSFFLAEQKPGTVSQVLSRKSLRYRCTYSLLYLYMFLIIFLFSTIIILFRYAVIRF